MSKHSVFELETLEELFLDQLEFKFRSIMLLLKFDRSTEQEIFDTLNKLESATLQDLSMLKKYVHTI